MTHFWPGIPGTAAAISAYWLLPEQLFKLRLGWSSVIPVLKKSMLRHCKTEKRHRSGMFWSTTEDPSSSRYYLRACSYFETHRIHRPPTCGSQAQGMVVRKMNHNPATSRSFSAKIHLCHYILPNINRYMSVQKKHVPFLGSFYVIPNQLIIAL